MAPLSEALGTAQPSVRNFGDYPALRASIFKKIEQALKESWPRENTRSRLELQNLHWADPDKVFNIQEQKKALLRGDSLTRRLSGTWVLSDQKTKQPLARKDSVIARVPYLTDRGTFILEGTEYTVGNQLRLRPGVYSRLRSNGELESHFNVRPGTGPSFRVHLEPKTGVFRLGVGQSRLKLYPLLKSMGVDDKEIEGAWGRDLLQANAAASDPRAVSRAYQTLATSRTGIVDESLNEELSKTAEEKTDVQRGALIRGVLEKAELDPEVTQSTMGEQHKNAGPKAILSATRKLLRINKNIEDVDDRDSLAYQTFLAPDDLFSERLKRDAGQTARRLLWQATFRRNLDRMPSAALTGQLNSLFYKSGLAQSVEETNPWEIHDQALRVTRMGDGGITSTDSIPDEARGVQPSHFGFIDPVRSPENEKIGVDNRLAHNTVYGEDGQLYTKVLDAKGRPAFLAPRDAAKAVIGFPGERNKQGLVRAMINSRRMGYVKSAEVKYWLDDPTSMFSPSVNLIPMVNGSKGGRALMAGKFFNQALPLKEPEAPLVRNAGPDGKSFDEAYGHRFGAVRADGEGLVLAANRDAVTVRGPDGKIKSYDLADHLPYNRRTFLTQTATVHAGQTVKPGDLLAHSNYTDKQGAQAVGRNLVTAYLPWKGWAYEDAVVVSESGAKKLSSEHLYQHVMENDGDIEIGRKGFLSVFPGKFPLEKLKTMDANGVIKPGAVVNQGDPLVLAVRKASSDAVHRGRGSLYRDAALTWDKIAPGVVTDTHETKDGGWNVTVKAYMPAQVGDKLAGRHGDKGVISRVVPDSEIPHTADGRPLDLVLNPLGVISRGNPNQVLELMLGKIARKRGQPINLPSFQPGSMVDYVANELKKEGLSDTEDLIDPETGRHIPKVAVGERWIMKLHHTAETKGKGRGEYGAYTSSELPARGSDTGSKRISRMENLALMAHGAYNTIEEAQTLRGQRNDDYWRQYRLGLPTPTLRVPLVYNKFLSHLQGAGVRLNRQGDKLNLFAMTDQDIGELSKGAIEQPTTVKHTTLDPQPGGLFDLMKTGGHNGQSWTHIPLSEPMPNPLMEDPFRRLLGLTQKQYEEFIAGKREVQGQTGGAGLKNILSKINLDTSIKHYEDAFKGGAKSGRDDAAKVLGWLRAMKKADVKPADLVWTKVPVLPPIFRPISTARNITTAADANFLYQDLMHANKDLVDYAKEVGPKGASEERLRVYHAMKAVAGLGDPVGVKSRQQRATGLLAAVFGGSPKFGDFQSRVIGMPVDLVGRATITPNPNLKMDEVGLPENKAWTVYRPFVIRRLIQQGLPATDAAQAVAAQSDVAKSALQEELKKRPVMINRAPTLHKYGFMAAWPVLVPGDVLQISPVLTKSFGADFDGDQMNYHPVVGDKAIKEAVERMMPSKNLLSMREFKPHYMPSMEFLYGLFLAGREGKGPRRTFASKQDAIRAYRRGELRITDPVSFPDEAKTAAAPASPFPYQAHPSAWSEAWKEPMATPSYASLGLPAGLDTQMAAITPRRALDPFDEERREKLKQWMYGRAMQQAKLQGARGGMPI